MCCGDVSRLAFDAVAERNAVIAGCPHRGFGGLHRVGRPRGQCELTSGKDPVAGLRRFIFWIIQRARDRVRKRESILRDNCACVRECRGIGNGRSRADRRRVVARHIRNRDRQKLCGMRMPGKAAALDAREMFAHRVDLADGRARAQERMCHRLLVLELRCRQPARSSWQTRRPTSAPARDRLRLHYQRASRRGRRLPVPLHRESDDRLRSCARAADAARSRGARPQLRSSALPQFAVDRDSALLRLRSSSRPLCPPQAR